MKKESNEYEGRKNNLVQGTANSVYQNENNNKELIFNLMSKLNQENIGSKVGFRDIKCNF